jgi:hypothetical protein
MPLVVEGQWQPWRPWEEETTTRNPEVRVPLSMEDPEEDNYPEEGEGYFIEDPEDSGDPETGGWGRYVDHGEEETFLWGTLGPLP